MAASPNTVTTLPSAPSISSPSTFAALADSFVAALPTFGTQLNSLGAVTYLNATEAASAATSASTDAAIASSAAANAAALVGASLWVSGTTYAIGDCRFSPTTFQTYRRKTNGAGTTDPASDTSNWTQISGLSPSTGNTLFLAINFGGL